MALRIISKISLIRLNSAATRSTSVLSNVLNRNLYSPCGGKSRLVQKSCENSILFEQKRYKYNKKGSAKQSTEEDSDDEDLKEFEDDVDKQRIVKIKVQSLRADLLLKSALGIARNKIEAAFYEGKIRVNGKKIQKKSVHCNEGDVLDIIKSESPTNPEHWLIGRLELMSVKTDGEEFIYLTIKRFKSLAVEKDEFK